MSQQFLSKYFKPKDEKIPTRNNNVDEESSRRVKSVATSRRSRNKSSTAESPAVETVASVSKGGGREGRDGVIGGKRKSPSRTVSPDTPEILAPTAEWICPRCTFRNTSATARTCEMCGAKQSPVSSPAGADVGAAPEEIAISSSDGDGGDDDGDSDLESASIGQHRKSAKARDSGSANGAASWAKKQPRTDSRLMSPSADSRKGKRHRQVEADETRASKRSPGSATSLQSPSASRNGIDHGMTTSQKDKSGANENGDHGHDEDSQEDTAVSLTAPRSTGAGRDASEQDTWPSIFRRDSGKGGSAGGAPSSSPSKSVDAGAVIITADSFNLQEDSRRRKQFQAGLNATPGEYDQNRSYHSATLSRGNGEGEGSIVSQAGDVHQDNAGKGSSGSDITTKGKGSGKAPAKGKGKGKTAGGIKLTPMEQQVSDLKAQHPGVLLLVECGYRYRFFGDDALIAAKVLRIYSHLDHNFQVASVPTFRLPVHLRRLVDAGYKVGVVRQAESAALKAAGLTESGKKSGTFKRELAAVFSQATWVEGAVEAFMPASVSQSGGSAGGKTATNNGGSGGGKGGGQGSWRKIGGAWRRIGGWGTGGSGRGGERADGGGGGSEESKTDEPTSEADLDAPLPQVDHERSEQWLLSVYEEDASPDASSEGEPIAIALALRDNKSPRNKVLNGDGEASDVDVGRKGEDVVRVGIVAVDVRTGKVVHDAFVEKAGQRRELDTRLRHLKPLELLAPGPRLSKATEATLAKYCDSAVDARGDKRVVRTERLPPEEFCFDSAQRSLTAYYGKVEGRGASSGQGNAEKPALTRMLDLSGPAISALGPLIAHLERFGLDRALAAPDLVSFTRSQYMTLDAVTLRDLEVLECQADGREAGSLFSILNRTQTAFGRRVLAGWVRQPLLSTEDITARQDAVEELATDPPPVIERLRPALRDLKDLDPAIASLHHRRIQPSRLLSLLTSMRKVFAVFHPPNGATATTVGKNSNVGGEARSSVLLEALAGVPADMASVTGRCLGELDIEAAESDDYVRALVDGERLCEDLASAAEAEDAASVGLATELQSVRAMLRKPSLQWKTLRTGVTSTVEYLVELRKNEAKKLAPASWMQVSQTKDLARFHTPGVLRLQQELLRARESRNIAARQAWAEFVVQVDEECYQGFRLAVHALGTLDALLSLAAVAQLPGYVRPVYRSSSSSATGHVEGSTDEHEDGQTGAEDGDSAETNGDTIVLRGARHPTVERVLEGGFVPNDVDLRGGECLVVTGPNMGGKSSTVRMVALICIMGQMGSYVPADSAELYCLDGVYTRMGAGDDLAADMSTFMVELWHTSYILKHATRRSLVVLDELGRGTSTHDGVAIALATLRHVVRDIGCATLFVTHYPQVADLASDNSLSGGVKNAHMSFIEHPGTTASETDREVDEVSSEGAGSSRAGNAQGVTFLYRLVVGQAHRSYGLNVARAAGMDEEMIKLASKKSAEMRDRSHDSEGTPPQDS